MGSQHSHEKSTTDGGSGANTPRGGSRRGTVTVPTSDSGSDIQESQSPSSMVPIEKLAKILTHKSQKEDGVNGVTEKIFVQYLFPSYPELGARVFAHVHGAGPHKHAHVSAAAFRAHSERLLAMLDVPHIVEVYLRMFTCSPEAESMQSSEFRALLALAARLAFDYYPAGPAHCPRLEETLSAIVDGCFHNKSSHSVGFVVRWSMDTCHRLILPLHRYVVHVMSSAYRPLEAGQSAEPPRPAPSPSPSPAAASPFGRQGALVSLSTAWLIAALAAPIYSALKPPSGAVSAGEWASRLACGAPAHWALLYAGAAHGLGANRLVYHVTNYRSPTVMVLSGGEGEGGGGRVLCAVLCGAEWRDSTRYFGGAHTCVLRLQPTVEILESGENLVYLNVQTRGYPRGLRAGRQPRAPALALDEDYTTLTVAGHAYPLHDIEVWGCGDAAIRDSQLDVKKWQVKEAERQRQIKLSPADWIEHPDRYLLELAGRPQYNNSGS